MTDQKPPESDSGKFRAKGRLTMKQNLVVLGATVAILLSTVGMVAVIVKNSQREEVPQPLTVQLLTTDPSFFLEKNISLSTAGFQQESPDRIVYRKFADQPPTVICTFTKPVDVNTVKRFSGRVTSVNGSVVTVSSCIPVKD